MNELVLPHGAVRLPAFFPDGTRGVVRCVDAADLAGAGVNGLVMNAYHLSTKPGADTIKRLGGLHAFTGWNRPIITDSGGFQVFSLLRENSALGEIRRNEIIFRRDGKKVIFSPQKCITSQLAYGADILMALDYCTHPSDAFDLQATAVDTTIRWGQKCMEVFNDSRKKPRGKETLKSFLFSYPHPSHFDH